ncbi:hypothetical protein MARPO_0043s0101, partial [Marchantia polymorpha]
MASPPNAPPSRAGCVPASLGRCLPPSGPKFSGPLHSILLEQQAPATAAAEAPRPPQSSTVLPTRSPLTILVVLCYASGSLLGVGAGAGAVAHPQPHPHPHPQAASRPNCPCPARTPRVSGSMRGAGPAPGSGLRCDPESATAAPEISTPTGPGRAQPKPTTSQKRHGAGSRFEPGSVFGTPSASTRRRGLYAPSIVAGPTTSPPCQPATPTRRTTKAAPQPLDRRSPAHVRSPVAPRDSARSDLAAERDRSPQRPTDRQFEATDAKSTWLPLVFPSVSLASPTPPHPPLLRLARFVNPPPAPAPALPPRTLQLHRPTSPSDVKSKRSPREAPGTEDQDLRSLPVPLAPPLPRPDYPVPPPLTFWIKSLLSTNLFLYFPSRSSTANIRHRSLFHVPARAVVYGRSG